MQAFSPISAVFDTSAHGAIIVTCVARTCQLPRRAVSCRIPLFLLFGVFAALCGNSYP
jgi:hypothetical protein